MKMLCACIPIALVLGCAHHEAKTAAHPYRYQHPLTSPGTQFGGLPPAVQTTVRAQAGATDIHQISKIDVAGETVYKVTFQDSDRDPPLYVATDGSVLYPDMRVAVGASSDTFGAVSGGAVSGVKFGDLPVNVANTIQQKAPTSEVAFINRITRGEKIFYDVTFKDAAHPEMFIAEDGTLSVKPPL